MTHYLFTTQGQSLQRVAVHLNDRMMNQCSLVYVALSRVTSSAGLKIFIEGDKEFKFPGPNPSPDIAKEMERLSKYEKLECVYDKMPQDPLLMAFNIRSFRKHYTDLLNDPVMTSAKIIFLFETGTKEGDEVSLPNYKVIRRIDAGSNSKRGTIAFIREDLNAEFKAIFHGTGHEVIGVQVSRTIFFGCYFSPSLQEKKSLAIISEMKSIASREDCMAVLCGDFNSDFSSKESVKCLSKGAIKLSKLITSATHDSTSTLDNVLTNSSGIKAIVYESSCSDHRPIFAVLDDGYESSRYPFATANPDCSYHAATHANRPSGSVPVFVPRVREGKPGPKIRSTRSTAAAAAAVSRVVDMQMVQRAEQILDQFRPLIVSTSGTEMAQWNWLPDFMDKYSEIDEIQGFIRDLVSSRDQRRQIMSELSSATQCIDHLPLPLRMVYKPLQTTGDGSCFYHALSLLLCGHEVLNKTLRLLVIYVFVRFRPNFTQFDDSGLLQELKQTCITEDDPESVLVSGLCWGTDRSMHAISEALQRPVVSINYGNCANLATSESFFFSRSMDELNHLIRSRESMEGVGLESYRYRGFVSRADYVVLEPFIISLHSRHFTALWKKEEAAPSLAFSPDTRLFFQSPVPEPNGGVGISSASL
jgi:hypothetical protein